MFTCRALSYGWTFTSSSRKKDKKYCHRQACQRCIMEFMNKQSTDHEWLLLATVSKNRVSLNNILAPRKCLFFSFIFSIIDSYINMCDESTQRENKFPILLSVSSLHQQFRKGCRHELVTIRIEHEATPNWSRWFKIMISPRDTGSPQRERIIGMKIAWLKF